MVSTVAYLLNARNVEPEKQPLLGNGSGNTPVAKQCLYYRHVIVESDAHVTIGEWLEAVFSVMSVPGSPETVARTGARKQSNVFFWKALPTRTVKTISENVSLHVTLICKM
jgi:hypothetical protein